MKKLTLEVAKRDVFGKKLNQLRKSGILPANVYGPDFKSTSISVNLKDFIKTYKIARETGVVHLKLDKSEIPTLIKYLQRHPVKDNVLHADFRKIDLTKKVITEVPVLVVGVSLAVSQLGGVLLTQSKTLLVEALPSDIPQAIEVDISAIKELGQEIKVSDLIKSDSYEFKTPVDKVVISVIAHKEESVTPDTTAAATEVLTETEKEVEGEGAEKASEKPADAKPADTKAENPGDKAQSKK
ncbi:MAG: 50S ribosomal protein L25 [Candidatus Roizmanbacteria bacterium GW2011_GWA2_35_19]|uniref:Large ribosomal subunit protein bL25 n=2 Tax=Candidatus Roizmaniibacteriota TaxID=1752723 RepID=A0A0G0F2W3_9BACT|nr:MAG: 50S ribosomal protein L25 [Candidatus Roizmanbacteria bacterium GW2011_GWC2_35_12]KKP73727.1 MAG: 50S ribosomal protein L25 [Candidatus Roizmanbacteria bacterium GW2011_GWA2_35_19]